MWTHDGLSTTVLESPVPVGVTVLVRLLEQLDSLLVALDDQQYARAPAARPSGSIGAHVRHCLDHVAAFLDGVTAGVLSYDNRVRNTRIETSRRAALDRLTELTGDLLRLGTAVLDRPLRLQVQLDPAGTACSVISTGGRELAFVISHTIHHNATMGVLLSEAGVPLPDRFGYAPATPTPAAA